jgi:hypothetical protein
MHATIQKPITEILRFIRPGEKVFVVGCNNCPDAWGSDHEISHYYKSLNLKTAPKSTLEAPF